MLHPEWLLNNFDEITQLYSDLHTDILKSIAKHISDTLKATGQIGLMPSMIAQINHAQATGLLRVDIINHIATTLAISKNEIFKLFESAAIDSVKYDNESYREAGVPEVVIRQSPTLNKILESGINKRMGSLNRLTGTIAINSEDLFERTLNTAYNKVVAGTHSYTEALKDGVADMLDEGVKVFNYESGHRISVEAAMLMNIRTGVSQTAAWITEQAMRERGATHVETSAHMGARNTGEGHKNHESWQGRVFFWKELDNGEEPKIDRNYANRVSELQTIATPGKGDITYETGAKASKEELNAYHWIQDNIGGNIKVLEEHNINGVKNPDAEWRGSLIDIKHTSGNTNTLSKRIQDAMRQTENGGAFVDISGAAYNNEDAIKVAISRMSGRNGGYVMLVRDGVLVGYINK